MALKASIARSSACPPGVWAAAATAAKAMEQTAVGGLPGGEVDRLGEPAGPLPAGLRRQRHVERGRLHQLPDGGRVDLGVVGAPDAVAPGLEADQAPGGVVRD